MMDFFDPRRSFATIAAEIEAMPPPRVIKTRESARAHHFRREHPEIEVRIVILVDSQEDARRAAPFVLAMPGDREIESSVDLRPVRLPGAMREDGTDEPDVEVGLAALKDRRSMSPAEQRALPEAARPVTVRRPPATDDPSRAGPRRP